MRAPREAVLHPEAGAAGTISRGRGESAESKGLRAGTGGVAVSSSQRAWDTMYRQRENHEARQGVTTKRLSALLLVARTRAQCPLRGECMKRTR